MGKHLAPIIAAVAPPAAAFAFLQTWALAHPWWAIGALAAWQLLVWGAAFVGKVVGGAADELNNRWKDPLAKSIDEGARRRLSRFERRYRESVLGNLRFIDLKGLATMGFYTPELDEVFVDVSLVHSDPSRVPSDVLGHQQVQPDRRFIGDLIDQPKPVLLAMIGAPGCGKTTLLRHTALLVCRTGRRRRRRIPVLLYLRDHVQAIAGGAELPDMIHREAPAGWFEQKLRAGSCVVLLDGLDEVADESNRREVSDWVERQVARYHLNDFVITSRPQGYQTAPIAGATVVQVRGFTDQQVTRFVRGWYFAFEKRSTGEKSADVARRAEAEATDLLERLHQNPSLYELTVNPLLLTMIANVHKFRGALPGSRVDLYGEICQVLLWRRQEAKKLTSELTGDQKMTLLSGLAYTMMSRQLRDITRDQVKIEFRSFLRRMVRTTNEDDFLADMTSSGLLLERERDLFAFAHLTFQEYLAAHHIREKQLTQVLVDNVDNVWWRETTLLHVARANADPIVQACLDSGTVRALSLAFDCSDEGNELAPELRAALDQLLETAFKPGSDPTMRGLMTRVVVSRHLRKVVRTDQGTRVCTEPVTNRIYRLFLESQPHRITQGPFVGPDEPVQGVWREDAMAFVDWVNEGIAVEQTFRLARSAELESSSLAKKLGSLAAWVGNSEMWPHGVMTSVLFPADLRRETHADLASLTDIIAILVQVRNALKSSVEVLYPPSLPALEVLKLDQVPRTATLELAIGRALLGTARHSAKHAKEKEADLGLLRAFEEVTGYPGDGNVIPVLLFYANYSAVVKKAPLTAWGQEIMPRFIDTVDEVMARTRLLTTRLASELRVAALCLALETDDDHASAFRGIAVCVSIMQRRADGRLPANETIVLATD